VSEYYRRVLSGADKTEKEYIQEKLRSAQWLIRSIFQRQRTIFKVTESIVKQQRGFFDEGIARLKPMILRDVAEDIEMHESTVSRVTTNKYVHTPHGIFPLKFFFNSGIQREDGADVASEMVKQRIKKLVGEEDARKPLSDSVIVKMLLEENIKIARRTVAKYRDMLGIGSSSQRRRHY
jgi:RNA polymerase sigma-54 factor